MVENLLNKLKISQKINLSFYISFTLIAALMIIPFYTLKKINKDYQKQIELFSATQQNIYNINFQLKQINSIAIESSLNKNSKINLTIERYYLLLQRNLLELQSNPFIDNNQELWQTLKNLRNRLLGFKTIAMSVHSEMNEDFEDGVYAILALSQANSKISYELNILLKNIKKRNKEIIKEIKENIDSTLKYNSIIILFALLALLLLNARVSKNIVQELNNLHLLINSFFDVLKKKRDKAYHVAIDTNDEIGKMAQTIDGNIHLAEELILQERNKAKEIEIEVDIATKEIQKLNKELHLTQKEIIHVMGSIAEEHSKETGLHIQRVASYSFLLAKLANLPLKDAILLRDASPMHDIGKLGIPDAILMKPAKFTDEEYEKMKQHTTIGYEMLKHSKRELLQTAAIIAYEHHERWDGKGYPQNLKGEDIHIFGRITAIVDVFDALASERVYKKAWPLERVLKLLEEEKGRQFDPLLVTIFLKNIDKFIEAKQSIEARTVTKN